MPTTELVLWGVVALLTAGLITFLVLFLVVRHRLAATRRQLAQLLADQDERRRRRRLGVAPLAIKTVFQTADKLINKGLGAVVRNSIEDLAGWAQVERPDLARLTADGRVVIAFSDIEGSTELNASMGDKAWVRLLGKHNNVIESAVATHGGHVVKNQGDGFMMAFADSCDAVRCSVAIQDALARQPFRVRIGVHMGTSVRRGEDLFGLDVALAARVAGQADGGEILVSAAVAAAVADGEDIALGPPREVELKGLPGTHPVYPVLLSARAAG